MAVKTNYYEKQFELPFTKSLCSFTFSFVILKLVRILSSTLTSKQII